MAKKLKLTFENFADYLHSGAHNKMKIAKELYLKNPEKTTPDDYEGGDLILEIIRTFRNPLLFVIKVIESEKLLKKGQCLYTMVEPSADESTHSIVYVNDTTAKPPVVRLVYDNWTEFWHYWFESKEEFENHLKAIHDIIKLNLKG